MLEAAAEPWAGSVQPAVLLEGSGARPEPTLLHVLSEFPSFQADYYPAYVVGKGREHLFFYLKK